MGRIHPEFCEHGNMIDGGSFYEPEEIKGCDMCLAEIHMSRLDELVERIRNWLKESPMSERISARRCRELRAICDEFKST